MQWRFRVRRIKAWDFAPSCLLPYVILTVCILMVFGQSLWFEFVVWDDDIHLYSNTLMNPPSWRALRIFLSQPFFGLYIPVTYSFWSLLAWIATEWSPAQGLDPKVFHLANIALHWINVILVFSLMRRLLTWPLAAFLGALVFALHPLQVEAVAWVSGGKDLICACFSLLALQALMRSRDHKYPRRLRVVASMYFLLAVLAKPVAVMLPLAAVLLLVWRRTDGDKIRISDWLTLGAWFTLIAPVIAATYGLQQSDIQELPSTTLLQRFMVSGDALRFYASKWLWPDPLLVDYSRTTTIVLTSAWRYIGLCFLLGSGALLFVAWWSGLERLVLALAIAFVGLLPNLGLVPFAYQKISTVADRYVYIPMFGLALACSWICTLRRRRFTAIVGCCVTVGWGIMSYQQCQIFTNTKRLFSHVVSHNPLSFSAHNNLAVLKIQGGAVSEGLQHLHHAVQLLPRSYKTIDNIGVALQMQGLPEHAVTYHERATQIEPKYATAWVNLANAQKSLGHQGEAHEAYLTALQVEPSNFLANNNFGVFLEGEGKLAEAEARYRAATRLSTDPYLAYYNLGVLFEKSGRNDEAAQAYRQALLFRPQSEAAVEGLRRSQHSETLR